MNRKSNVISFNNAREIKKLKLCLEQLIKEELDKRIIERIDKAKVVVLPMVELKLYE